MAKPRSLALLASLVSLTTLALACASKFQIDPAGYCDDVDGDPICPGGSSTGGRSGSGGGGGGGGGTMGDGGSGQGEGGGGGGGGGSLCEEGKTDCGGTCFDLLTDPAHCGDCSRNCGGAVCEAGACKAEPIVVGEVAPYALADDDAKLYWVSPAGIQGVFSPRVRTTSKTLGAPAANLFPGTLVRASSLAVAPDGFLYWGSLGTSPTDTAAQRIARGKPGDPDGVQIVGGQFIVQHVALGPNDRIYWTVEDSAAVRGAAVTGVGGVDLNITDQSKVGWLAVDGDEQPYWVLRQTGEVRRRALGEPPDTSKSELVTTSTNPISVELGNGRVYWADRTLGVVRSAPKGELQSVATDFEGKGAVEGFALKGAAVYVLTLAGGADGPKILQLWQARAPTPLLLGQVPVLDSATYVAGNPFGAAYVRVDETYVYFADVGTITGLSGGVALSNRDGVIYRVAR